MPWTSGPDARSRGSISELESGDLDGYLWIAPAAATAGPARPTFTFTPRSSEQDDLRSSWPPRLGTVLMREQLARRGIVAADADTLLQPVDIVAAHRRGHRQDRESAVVSVAILFFLMYMVIMLYGMNVARSIIEEKTSRIFEVMLATIRPEEMMAGKILGVGSVGLTQVGIWLTAGTCSSPQAPSPPIPEAKASTSPSPPHRSSTSSSTSSSATPSTPPSPPPSGP